MEGSYSKSCNIPSVRKQVFELWTENSLSTAKPICKFLGLEYKDHGRYVNRLLSEFRYYYVRGSPQRPHRCVFVWECVEGDRDMALGVGWRRSKNRNGFLVFEGSGGAVHWYQGGKVMLYLKHGLPVGKAKELFSRAFGSVVVSDEYLCRLLDAPMKTTDRHYVFDVAKKGERLPRFKIDRFTKSHGLTIYTDGSHPSAIEVREQEPFWLQKFGEVTEAFGDQIKSHLNLVEEWRKEASVARQPDPDTIGYTNLNDPYKAKKA